MRTLALALALLTGGCTAAKANIQLVSAEQALVRARSSGADEVAEYEYTMAVRYLEKAQEEAGYSEFRIADALARKSAEWADRAVIFMQKRGKTDINLDDFSNVPDVAPPPTTPEPELVPPPPPSDEPGEVDRAEPDDSDFELDDDIEIPR